MAKGQKILPIAPALGSYLHPEPWSGQFQASDAEATSEESEGVKGNDQTIGLEAWPFRQPLPPGNGDSIHHNLSPRPPAHRAHPDLPPDTSGEGGGQKIARLIHAAGKDKKADRQTQDEDGEEEKDRASATSSHESVRKLRVPARRGRRVRSLPGLARLPSALHLFEG